MHKLAVELTVIAGCRTAYCRAWLARSHLAVKFAILITSFYLIMIRILKYDMNIISLSIVEEQIRQAAQASLWLAVPDAPLMSFRIKVLK